METLRDTAFGKLVRLCSHYKWMQYPEEQDASVWPEYLKTETETKEEGEASTPTTENENPEDVEAFGIYAVMSQCSTRSRRMSTVSTLHGGSMNSSQANQPLVISWRGPDDPEVCFLRYDEGKLEILIFIESSKLEHKKENAR